jgi:hypothetical protein
MKLGLNTNKNNRATQSLSPPKRGKGDNLKARENIPPPRLGGEKFPLNITSRIDLLNRSRRRELALIKHGQNTDEQKRFPSPVAARHPLPPTGRDFPDRKMSRIEPLNRSRRRESALTFVGLKVRGLIPQCGTATRFRERVSRSNGWGESFLFIRVLTVFNQCQLNL